MDAQRKRDLQAFLESAHQANQQVVKTEGCQLIIACNEKTLGELLELSVAGEFDLSLYRKPESAEARNEGLIKGMLAKLRGTPSA